jgi:hypothetical protein
MAQVRVNPSGVLNKDMDLQYISQGDYIDANDIRHRSLDGQDVGGIVPVKGNTEVVSNLSYAATNRKKYRIFFDLESLYNGSLASHEATFYYQATPGGTIDSSGGLPTPPDTFLYTYAFGLSVSDNLDQYALDLQDHFTQEFSGFATFGTLVTNATDSTLTPYQAYFDYWDTNDNEFTIWLVNISGEVCKVQLIEEYIAVGGNFKVVGSVDLNQDVFVWLASEDTKTGLNYAIVSEVGIIRYQEPNTYTYTRLIRSSNLNLSPEYRVQAEVEKVGNQINLYWTDRNNKPRVMYLKSDNIYTQDGFLVSEGGRYELENIDLESSLIFPAPSSYIDNVRVIDGGGQILSGNKRYSGRFVTSDYSYTDFLYPTNPVNIYNASFDKPFEIAGDLPFVQTNKSVSMTIQNIDPGIYSFFDLVAIEYTGDHTFTAKVVQRFPIANNQTSLDVTHTDIGQTAINLAPEELLAISAKYSKVGTLRVFDNRLTVSNLEDFVDIDISSWASTITHSLEYTSIPSVGDIGTIAEAELDLNFGEYLDPLNTLQFTSYMFNDTYRFGIQVQWKDNGKWSSPFWVDDIRFDTESFNIDTASSRRSANNITSNLTSEDYAEEVYIYYLKFSLDLDYLVNGTPIRDLIKSFKFVRAERIPEVLATGYFLPGAYNNLQSGTKTVMPFLPTMETFSAPPVLTNFPNISIKGSTPGTYLSVTNTNSSDYLYFYSPDQKFGQTFYSFDSNKDELRILGVPYNIRAYGGTASNADAGNVYYDQTGYFTSSPVEYLRISSTGTTITLEDHVRLQTGESKVLAGRDFFNGVKPSIVAAGTYDYDFYNFSCEGFKLSATLKAAVGSNLPSSFGRASEDFAIYYGQIFRNLGANKKYPSNKEFTTYESTGHIRILFNGENGTITESVFGGDVYTQKTHFQIRMAPYRSPQAGFGAGFALYSQNVVNSQMFNILEHDLTHTGAGYVFPQYLDKAYTGTYSAINTVTAGTVSNLALAENSMGSGLFYWLQQWPEVSNQNAYNKAYNFVDASITDNGYDPNNTFDGKRPTTIAWSNKKITGSLKDNYRVFSAIDFRELDLTSGEIVNHEIVNDVMYTWQRNSFQRQYFNEASAINSQTGTDIILGTGGVMSVPGVELTSIGCDKKWSIIKGRTANGKDSVYWYNDQLKKIVRFGQDGNRVISDRGLVTFLNQNMRFLNLQDESVTGLGIHGVWNDKYSEAIFTFKSYNPNSYLFSEEGKGTGSYEVGDLVYKAAYTHESGLPYLYRCLQTHLAATPDYQFETGASWQSYWEKLDPLTDSNYTLFTLVYDELKSGFVGFHSYWPNIYLQSRNVFYSPNPLAENDIYIHDSGFFIRYYGTNFEGGLTSVMNYDTNMPKIYEAVQFVTDTAPAGVEFQTRDHESYLQIGDFDEREDYYYSTIKNDSTNVGVNFADTSRLFGRYLVTKLKFSPGVYQKLINYIVKFRPSPRLYNT